MRTISIFDFTILTSTIIHCEYTFVHSGYEQLNNMFVPSNRTVSHQLNCSVSKVWNSLFCFSISKHHFFLLSQNIFFVFSFGHFKTIFPLRNIDFFFHLLGQHKFILWQYLCRFRFYKIFQEHFFSFHNCAIFRFGQLLFFHCLMFTFTSEYDFKTIGPDHLCPFTPFLS